MSLSIRKAVVLGAGTMGAQVAAHLAAQGIDVALLDLVPDGATDKSVLARRAAENLKKMKPSPLALPELVGTIRPGNFDDDLARELKDADWVFEAVLEDLAVKQALFARVVPHLKKTAVLSTNTSGLPIAQVASALPADVQRRFLGTHFFNPPRYLKLLETIPGPHTDLALLQAMERFCEQVVGKGVVRCKDTPNFIANRIGSYGLGKALSVMQELELSVEEIDALTGPAIGRAKSATFRTADIAGVDICVKVAQNLYDAVPGDPERALFQPPAFMKAMLEKKWLGDKTGIGFYKKEGKEILALDWKTLEHKPRSKPKFASLEAAKDAGDAGARLAQIVQGSDKGAQFLWQVLSATSLYAATLVPEISDDVTAVDRAMEWGYAWGLGPFRLLDAIGVKVVAERAAKEGRAVPKLISDLLASGRTSFYAADDKGATVFGPTGVTPLPPRDGVVELPVVKARAGAVLKKNAGASFVDLGDGVGLVEFHSKMNSLGTDTFSMLAHAAKEGRNHFDALVIGNQGDNFTVGANLMLALLAAQEEEWDELELSIRQFQRANMALKCADIPVVVAPFGLTLGGGCEIALHGSRVRLSAETYMGLVEVGVGLIPAGGGTKEMALRALDRVAGVEGADAFAFVKRAFDLIAFGKVATSGAEARQWFLNPADSVSPHPDRLLGDAKQVALGLARAGYRPASPRAGVLALGRPALSIFKMGIYNAQRGGQISDHDALIAGKVAHILCGGDRAPGLVSEQHYLDLEREAFLSLLGTRKSQERIGHMLKTGKPLRN
ncbi:MAG: 3-hydroxyacyl-CoA dehydrogenase/enoyl-CoA hydratase family protein [Vicinamibacteria bacterium]|nr:3-hydroxyacyl-CoA dehydrogenase/enoyl-CoA hydratase family protein [Vicinamibacteria bacterium]